MNPNLEVLFEDLENNGIGSYLESRAFKSFMSKKGAYGNWKQLFISIKNNSGIISTTDFSRLYLLDTFKVYLDDSLSNASIKQLVSEIIIHFIESSKERLDLDDFETGLTIAKFNYNQINSIQNAIINNQKLIKNDSVEVSSSDTSIKLVDSKDIFIVHGHADELKEKVARTVSKLGFNPIVLHEKPNKGRTIIEKFEHNSNVGFAIVLLTKDDNGKAKSDRKLNFRARQNVILELGYFFAKLGRERVMALYEDGVELPIDISGIIYTPYNKNNSQWKFDLVKFRYC